MCMCVHMSACEWVGARVWVCNIKFFQKIHGFWPVPDDDLKYTQMRGHISIPGPWQTIKRLMEQIRKNQACHHYSNFICRNSTLFWMSWPMLESWFSVLLKWGPKVHAAQKHSTGEKSREQISCCMVTQVRPTVSRWQAHLPSHFLCYLQYNT